MSLAALTLILVGALLHAGWNYLLKKSGGGPGFVALVTPISSLLLAPAGLFLMWRAGFMPNAAQWSLIVTSALIHTAYFLLLEKGYRVGDLSVIYPLARATGPLLTIVVAVALMGERPGPLAILGALAIAASALFLMGNPFNWHKAGLGAAIGFALLTGTTIAAYTLVDKHAVAALLVPPLVYDWLCNTVRTLFVVPYVRIKAPGDTTRVWRTHRRSVIAIALMSPLSYICALTAMVFTPVSYVAPAREVSILFAALMGTHLLNEGNVRRKLIAASGMVLGLLGLAIG